MQGISLELNMETNLSQGRLPTLLKISETYNTMTRTQKKIGDYVYNNPAAVVKSSITELSVITGVKSEASIVRFYRLLGFKSYKEFKICIAQELAGRTFYHSYEDINLDDSPSEVKKKIFSGAISTLLTNEQYDNVQSYIDAHNLIAQAGRIIFLGYAASAAMCYYAYFRFIELGYNCHFFTDSHINAAVLTKPHPKDLIFCISHSGETQDLITALDKIAHKDVSVILITSSENSTLAKLADVVLLTKGDETNIATDAMSSRVAQLCIIDSLFSIVSLGGGQDALSRLMMTRQTFMDYKKK
jgi:RpiR family transcriptional regulator, carbohydrate utilization regulator